MKVLELLEKYEKEVVPKHSERTQKDYAWHLVRHTYCVRPCCPSRFGAAIVHCGR